MNINNFGHHSLISWTEEDLRKERKEMDKEYICLSTDKTLAESDLRQCPKCKKYSCSICGGEVSTIEEYDKAMRINAEES